MNEESGILYGIGVGPGGGDLLTLRAVRVIRAADLICLPQPEKEACRAYRIAREAVPELADKACVGLVFPMTRDESALRQAHECAYQTIREALRAGKSLAFLTIGDPTVYSTFTYLAERATADGVRVELVSGVTSYQAVAARLGISLCEGDEELHVATGQSEIERVLTLPGTKVFMKCGRRMAEIKARLEAMERSGAVRVYAVTDCGLDTERMYQSASGLPDTADYMTTIIVKENQNK